MRRSIASSPLVAMPGFQVGLTVADSGPGVPVEQREPLFRRFYRQGGGPGAGLGLSIAQRLVQLMGGDMGARSTPGQGSVFWFETPLQPPATAAAASASAAAPTSLFTQA